MEMMCDWCALTLRNEIFVGLMIIDDDGTEVGQDERRASRERRVREARRVVVGERPGLREFSLFQIEF
jgi:hypothetical protein